VNVTGWRRYLPFAFVIFAVIYGGHTVYGLVSGHEHADHHHGAASTASQPDAAAHSFHPVAGSFKPDGTKLDSCTEPRCLEQAFGNIAYYEGPKPALRLFASKMETDKLVESDCHRIVHTIGSATLSRERGNVGKAFAQGDSLCWSGFYHGILEHALLGVNGNDGLAKAARKLCSGQDVRKTAYISYQCVHGLGHGLMIQTGLNLPLSLATCDRLQTTWDQVSCTSGVFMENFSTSYGVESPWTKKKEPIYPCNWVKERHKLYCYLMVTSRILALNGYDFIETAETCREAESSWISTCFHSFGRDASGITRQDPQRVVEICALAKGYIKDCYVGASKDFTSNYANGIRAGELCRKAPDFDIREACFGGVGEIIGTLSTSAEQVNSMCVPTAGGGRPLPPMEMQTVKERGKYDWTACMRGAGVRLR
jgi:hypothetical protein